MPIMVLSIFAVGRALTHSFSFPHFSPPPEHKQFWEERWRRTRTVPGMAGWVLLGCIQEFSASWQRSASAFCFSSWRTVAALPHFDKKKSKLSVLGKSRRLSWKCFDFCSLSSVPLLFIPSSSCFSILEMSCVGDLLAYPWPSTCQKNRVIAA